MLNGNTLGLVVVAGGFFLDLVVGEPPEYAHPVVWIGGLIDWLKRIFMKLGGRI